MDCAEEVSLLRKQLGARKGVYDLRFDILQAKMTVEFDPARIPYAALAAAVAETGMKAEPWRDAPAESSWWTKRGRLVLTALSGAFLAVAVAFHAQATGSVLEAFLHHDHAGESLSPWAILACAAAILAGSVYVLPKAFYSFRTLQPDMNALVVISLCGAAYLGEWMEGASLAFLFALAAVLESYSMARARNAVAALMRIAPGHASVVHGDHEHKTPIGRVPAGALVRVRPGERIPCDGEVVGGGSDVNQAMITGESVPVWKEPGEEVYAGSMNGDGVLDVRTTRTAGETTLARIVRMVERAQQRRAPSEQFVERFARVYTPAMLLLALAVAVLPPLAGYGLWSAWFYQAMVILLISCPCALVISTPVSVVAALASAARHGVLVKGGAYLEEAARIRAVAFDKTGVLTGGHPEVRRLTPVNGHSERLILERLAALESASSHPVARAVVKYAEERGIQAPAAVSFQALQGRGAEAEIGGVSFWAGSLRMAEEKGLATPALRALAEAPQLAGETVMICGAGGEPWAVVGLHDPPRAEARDALARLRACGVEHVVMLTGDNPAAAARAAGELGIADYQAGLLPEDKALAVAQLRRRHRHVAMVGDGVNDAQAMSESTLGVALGAEKVDAVLETADVLFLNGGLSRLPFLLRHARRTVAVIRQNVALALGLKAVFLALALAGSATLWMAVAADMGATILVTFNGLRLLHARTR